MRVRGLSGALRLANSHQITPESHRGLVAADCRQDVLTARAPYATICSGSRRSRCNALKEPLIMRDSASLDILQIATKEQT